MPKQLHEAKVVHIDSLVGDSKFSARIEKTINEVFALDDSPAWEYKNAFEAGKQVHIVFVRPKK